MKNIKKQADELVELHFGEIANAITTLEYTIEVLNMCNAHSLVDFTLNQQTELLTELKSRL